MLTRLAPVAVALALALSAQASGAAAAKPKLERLPADKLEAMPALLHHGDVALIESLPNGRLKQVTLITFVRAPAKVVHDVVADPARQPEFMRNMSKSKV